MNKKNHPGYPHVVESNKTSTSLGVVVWFNLPGGATAGDNPGCWTAFRTTSRWSDTGHSVRIRRVPKTGSLGIWDDEDWFCCWTFWWNFNNLALFLMVFWKSRMVLKIVFVNLLWYFESGGSPETSAPDFGLHNQNRFSMISGGISSRLKWESWKNP